jgi:hypothetical protein
MFAVLLSAWAGYFCSVLPASSTGYHLTISFVGAVCGAIFGFPVGLGVGWFWGTIMAASLGLEPDPKQTERET